MDSQYEQDYKVLRSLPQALQDKVFPPSDNIFYRQKFQVARINALLAYPAELNKCGAARVYDSACGILHASGLPPITNRGGNEVQGVDGSETQFSIEAREFLKLVPIGKGKTEKVWVPLPDRSRNRSYAFVDWINFTFKTANYPLKLHTGHAAISDEDYVTALSIELYKIFGYGVDCERETGLNFYKRTWNLPYGWGHVCIGGQRDSVLVSIKGQGLAAAASGWERRLYDYLKTIPHAKITRVDLAHDNHYSSTTVDDYLTMYRTGLFRSKRRAPEVECLGNWEKPNGKGRTLYVGSRSSGKLLRIYEKGLQLANGFHNMFPDWLRVELELKNIDREIPFEVLLRPGQYLAGAYPALANMHLVQEFVKTQKNVIKSTFERSIETTRHQFGAHIWLQIQILGAEEFIKRVTKEREHIPKSLQFDTFVQLKMDGYQYLHDRNINIQTIEDLRL